MTTVGSFVVNTYMNNESFLAGARTATAAAKKMETGIGESMARINAKQMKNVMTSGLKAVGVVGAIEMGQQIMLATIKGMADGSVKGMADFGRVAANAITTMVKGIPVLGTFMQIGEEIGKWIAGINELEAATDKSKTKFIQTSAILSAIAKSQGTATTAIESAFKATQQFGLSDDVIKQQNLFSEMQKQDFDANQLYKKMRKQDMIDEATDKTKGWVDQNIIKKRSMGLSETIAEREQQQLITRNQAVEQLAAHQADLAKKTQDALAKQQEDEDRLSSEKEKRLKLEKEIASQLSQQTKAAESLIRAQENFDQTEANLTEQAAGMSSVTGIGSAIGEVKVQGAANFSVEKQIDVARQSLMAAKTSVEQLKKIADGVEALGATT